MLAILPLVLLGCSPPLDSEPVAAVMPVAVVDTGVEASRQLDESLVAATRAGSGVCTLHMSRIERARSSGGDHDPRLLCGGELSRLPAAGLLVEAKISRIEDSYMVAVKVVSPLLSRTVARKSVNGPEMAQLTDVLAPWVKEITRVHSPRPSVTVETEEEAAPEDLAGRCAAANHVARRATATTAAGFWDAPKQSDPRSWEVASARAIASVQRPLIEREIRRVLDEEIPPDIPEDSRTRWHDSLMQRFVRHPGELIRGVTVLASQKLEEQEPALRVEVGACIDTEPLRAALRRRVTLAQSERAAFVVASQSQELTGALIATAEAFDFPSPQSHLLGKKAPRTRRLRKVLRKSGLPWLVLARMQVSDPRSSARVARVEIELTLVPSHGNETEIRGSVPVIIGSGVDVVAEALRCLPEQPPPFLEELLVELVDGTPKAR